MVLNGEEHVKKRNYRVWLFLLSPNGPAFWEWDNWMKVSAVIDPLIKLTRGKPTMDVFQTSKTGRKVNQGALLWNPKNMQKWTHHSPLTNDFTEDLNFNFVNMWCPSEVRCSEEGIPADCFVQLKRLQEPFFKPSDQVGQIVTIAVAQDLAEMHEELLGDCLSKLERLFHPVLLAELTSRWVYRKDGTTGDCLNNIRRIFKSEWDWGAVPTSDMFEKKGAIYEIVKCT